jgi:serine/threonine protein kinase/Tol biopolymer transport system component
MTPERWREVERLYHAALERPADQRARFLADACGGDTPLRQEIESLFEYGARAKDFMAAPPASGLLAGELRRREEASVPGRFIGRAFGAYQVEALIAAGGMGEVYRAIDTRLQRTVALKTLRADRLDDPDRRARFVREARIVSSLTHPHICTLHDVGMQDDVDYLVMEHIEGETLQKQLERGPLPLARALEYAIQVADALDRAHRRGVIHRDLKPGNVMVTKSGVKLLDFGLAVHLPAPVGAEADPDTRSRAATAAAAIMGTPQYIAPEQLEGKQADTRTDIFAFGTLAYEMITGRPAFPVASRVQLVVAILEHQPPPIGDSVPAVPPRLVETLSRCLCKDPDDRWQSASDLLFELRSIARAAGADEPLRGTRPGRIERALWASAVVVSLAAALFWTRDRGGDPEHSAPAAVPVRYTLPPAEGTTFYSGYGVPFALSPDGRQIVYASVAPDGTEQLRLRSLYSQSEQALPGTERANTPFWSADGQWIGFFADNSLKKIRVSSGLTQVVAANVQTKGGASWGAGDVIVFSTGPGGLSRVAAGGGPVARATTLSEGSHFWPQFLADGTHFIYAAAPTASICLGSLGGEAPKTLMKFPVRISALAYVPGYVFFVQDAALFARPFDDRRLEFSGEPIRIVGEVPVMGPGRAPFSVSAAGVLAYWPYPVGTPAALRWFDRTGRASAAVETPALYGGVTLAPDGRRVAFSRAARSGGADVWVRDLVDGSENRVTFDGAAFTPQWSPDGARILFTGPGEQPPLKLFIKTVANAAAAVRVGVSRAANFASGWSGDGRVLVSVRIDPAAGNDVWIHRLADDVDAPLTAINTTANESHARVSPDSRWIAYDTDASGRSEVWVASFPDALIRRQVSAGGGSSPEWSQKGREIVFIEGDRRLMAAAVSGRPDALDVSPPRPLFPIEHLVPTDQAAFPTANAYAVASNGERFLVAVAVRDPDAPPINIVVNWRALLNR